MTRDEIKEEILNDEEQQFKTTTAAQFAALNKQLVKKGLLTKEDLDEINKLTNEYVEKINEQSVDTIMEMLSVEDNDESI